MFCTTCGAELQDGARFCGMCGAPVDMPNTQSETAPAPVSGVQPQPVVQPAVAPAAPASAAPTTASQSVPAPAPQPAAPASQPATVSQTQQALEPYVQQIATRLGQTPQLVPGLQTYLFVTKRMSVAAAQMHQYFFIYANDLVGYNEMRDYAAACTEWALHNYEGVPRGMQKGLAIYPVMLQHPLNPSAVQFVKEKPKVKYAAFTMATLVDPIDHQIQFLDATPIWGHAMWKGIKKAAVETLA